MDVFEVLRSPGQDLGDDEVFRADDGDRHSGDVHLNGARKEQLLETWPGHDQVHGNPFGR